MDARTEGLIDEIIVELERIFGDNGFDGTPAEYAFVLKNFGVTEEEDVRWQHVLEVGDDDAEELDPDDDVDAETIAFLGDDVAIVAFLEALLAKYRSSDAVFPRG